jgi:8-oxo-dGTP diphosphatase
VSETVRAAGGLVRRIGRDGSLEVLVVHRPAYDDWSLPKGKLEPGETDEQAALREVEEETGVRCELGRELPASIYLDAQGRTKVVRYWLMNPVEGDVEGAHEVDDARFVPVGEAARLLTYARDRELLAHVGGGSGVTIHLIRHAKAKNRLDWDSADELRPLSKRGRREAEAIAERLAGQPVARIVSSPHLRCVQTVEPLAVALDLPVETTDALAEGAGGEAALELLLALAPDGSIACCTHGDVVFAVAALVSGSGVLLDGPLQVPVASAWSLEVDSGHVVGARFVPQPPRR